MSQLRPEHRGPTPVEWGSDAIAMLLRDSGIPYVTLCPGSSVRGLHDSLVNLLGGEQPEPLVCLHEEHAVAIAHGYAKVSGEALVAVVHTNVGLLHASMAIYNAWCDRAPMLVIAGSGPLAVESRKPWIDWIHAPDDPAGPIRSFVKSASLPRTVAHAVDAVARALAVSRSHPQGPTLVSLETPVQEAPVAESQRQPSSAASRHRVSRPTASSVDDAIRLLRASSVPVILAGRLSRDEPDWARRIHLAEHLGARVITDIKAGAAFPTDHPLHVPGAGFFLSAEAKQVLAAADCVLSLDWIDLAGTLVQAGPSEHQRILIAAGPGAALERPDPQGIFAPARVDAALDGRPDDAVAALLKVLRREGSPRERATVGITARPASGPINQTRGGSLTMETLADQLQRATAGVPVCLARLPIGWPADAWPLRHPLDYVGYDGGAGIGSGPGMAVGVALALRGTGRLPMAILGDGDLLMGMSALWTAARYRIPLLIVAANNRAYLSDVAQQERVAIQRGRDPANRWIGQTIDDPPVDLAALARAQGLEAWGPTATIEELAAVLPAAVSAVLAGAPVLVDALVDVGAD